MKKCLISYRITQFLVVLFCVLICRGGYSQSPYQLNKKQEIAYLGLGFGSLLTAGLLHNNVPRLTEGQIRSLNPNDVSSFDRDVIGNYSGKAKTWSDIVMLGSTVFPISAYVLIKDKQESKKVGLMFLETISITYGVTHVVKNLFPRNRPFTYDPDVDLDVKQGIGARKSFFSGHTSYAAATSFFSASVISAYSNNNTIKGLAWTGAAIVPAVSGFLRMKAGKHFPTDVAAGYVFGAAVGYLIPKLHEMKNKSEVKIYPFIGGESSGVYVSIPLSISRKFQDY